MENVKSDTLLYVRISAASSIIWEGRAHSVSSENSDGRFDILGMHSNFITLIRDAPIIITQTDGEVKEFTFPQSVIQVIDNHVRIFADIKYIRTEDITEKIVESEETESTNETAQAQTNLTS